MSERFNEHLGRVFRGRAHGSVPLAILQELVDQPEKPLSAAGSIVIKSDQSGTVVRWNLMAGTQSQQVAYKFAAATGLVKSLRVLLRLDRASGNWRTATQLRRRGISTPRPLVTIVPRFGHSNAGTYIVTEWLNRAMQVDHFLQSEGTSCEKGRHLETCAAESLGRLIGDLHRSDYMHRDLKVANLMLQIEDDEVHASFVDLDGIRWLPWISRRRRMKDLARFSVCFPDDVDSRHAVRLRFLRAYLTAFYGHSAGWKKEWCRLAAATEKLRSRKLIRNANRFGSAATANENSLDGTSAIETECDSTSGKSVEKAA